jgi:WD40 repeat protein
LTRRRLALIVTAAVALPYLPGLDEPPAGPPMQRVGVGRRTMLLRLAFSPDGRMIAAPDEQGRAWLVPMVKGAGPARVLDTPGFAGVVAFSPDGRHLAVGGPEPDVVLCDLARGGPGRPLGVPVREATSLSFSPDGATLAISSRASPEIILWDLEAARPRSILRGPSSPVVAVAFRPDGRTLTSMALPSKFEFACPSPSFLIWDIPAGRPRIRLDEPHGWVTASSLAGRRQAIANAAGGLIELLDLRSGRRVGPRIAPHGITRAMALSPDERLLATVTFDGSVSVWDVATGREIYRLDGRAEVLHGVAFSPDGKTLAATGSDGEIRLWDLGGWIRDEAGT